MYKRLFTVTDYAQMAQAGIVREDDRLELFDGELYVMAPISSAHAACVRRLHHLLTQALGDQVLVDTQQPIALHNLSEPMPDVLLLQPRADWYATGHPRPSEVLLAIEVADLSLAYDQEVKIPAYARSHLPEVWVIDLPAAVVHVYRRPSPQGYQEVTLLHAGDTLAPQVFPAVALAVASLVEGSVHGT
jgi:Uma2 family endonuclease